VIVSAFFQGLIFVGLCAFGLLAGLGILRLLGIGLDNALRASLAPFACGFWWILFLGISVASKIPVKDSWMFMMGITGCLALLGLHDVIQQKTIKLLILPALLAVAVLTIPLLFYFRYGLFEYFGSPLADGWSYAAVGQYIWQTPRGLEGGLPPLYQYATHLNHSRYIASALLAAFSPLTGTLGDTKAASGLFLGWSLFVFSTSCAFLARSHGLSQRWSFIAGFIAICFPWIPQILWANNFDQLLSLAFPVIVVGLAKDFDLRRWPLWVFASLTIAAFCYVYPEMTPPFFAVGFAVLLWRIISSRGSHAFPKAFFPAGVMVALAVLLILPFAGDLFPFIKGQFSSVLSNKGVRPGEGMFTDLLQPYNWPKTFFGWLFENTRFQKITASATWITGVAMLVLFGFGVAQSLRKRFAGVLLFIGILLTGAMEMILRERYGYGAYKFITFALGGLTLLITFGLQELWEKIERRFLLWDEVRRQFIDYRAAAIVVICLVFLFPLWGYAIIINYSHDKRLPEKRMAAYRSVQSISKIVGSEAVYVDVTDSIANQWAVYYLRNLPVKMGTLQSYMAQPHVVPFMERATPISLDKVRYQLVDSSTQIDISRRVWASSEYVLIQKPLNRNHITIIENANGLESWQGEEGFWVGTGDTRIHLVAIAPGKIKLSAQFIPGPSIPDTMNRIFSINLNGGPVQRFQINNVVELVWELPVTTGENVFSIRSLDIPTTHQLSNGDVRPLLIGVRGLKIIE
jgi:hypothetical protein